MALKQITVWGKNQPGNLARITSAVAGAGVNLGGLFASDTAGRSAVRLLVGNPAKAKAALRKAGYKVSDEPALLLTLADRPGRLAKVAGLMARKRINIKYAYATVSPKAQRTYIVLGVGNAAAARRALKAR